MPALLTRMSSRPCSSPILAAAASTEWSSVTSSWMDSQVPLMYDRDLRRLMASTPLVGLRLPIITWYLEEWQRRFLAV
jgi:hypothetical protein